MIVKRNNREETMRYFNFKNKPISDKNNFIFLGGNLWQMNII